MSGVAPFYLLSRSDEQYRQVKDRFNRKWSRSDGPPPRIENIFHVDEAEFRASHREADMFSQTRATGCGLKAMLLCKYVPGRVQRLRIGNPFRTRPCRGYDSVEAVLMKDGGMTNHHEAVVYRDDAIVPVGVITYMK
ncbi:unnamed protein product [Fusarium graminearum]|nr:unnamed protein product [Fusarium graminearum]